MQPRKATQDAKKEIQPTGRNFIVVMCFLFQCAANLKKTEMILGILAGNLGDIAKKKSYYPRYNQ